MLVKDFGTCKPYGDHEEGSIYYERLGKECGFVNLPARMWSDWDKDITPWTFRPSRPGKQLEEFKDWLEEFPLVILEKGTKLVHSSRYLETFPIEMYYNQGLSYTDSDIGQVNNPDEPKGYVTKYLPVNMDNLRWFDRYYPGQSNYLGGWFIYETGYGGPDLGINITYELLKDVSLFFVPGQWKDPHGTGWTGSHTVPGVSGWMDKGYDEITHEYFADNLGIRLASLGFNGYISCDECEVYLSHKVMKNVLSDPLLVTVGENEKHHPQEHLLFESPRQINRQVTSIKERPISG